MKKTKLFVDARTDAEKHRDWRKASGLTKPPAAKKRKVARPKMSAKQRRELVQAMVNGAMMGVLNHFASRAIKVFMSGHAPKFTPIYSEPAVIPEGLPSAVRPRKRRTEHKRASLVPKP